MRGKIKEIPGKFPMLCDIDCWSRFIRKAIIGSYKAVSMHSDAEMALMEFTFGKEIEASERLRGVKLKERIEPCPFSSPQEIMKKFATAAQISLPVALPKKPVHPVENYYDRYNSYIPVEEFELLIDASFLAFKEWNYNFYYLASETAFENDTNYNSLDLTACMMILISSFVDEVTLIIENNLFIGCFEDEDTQYN